jgi:hypothetical protein
MSEKQKPTWVNKKREGSVDHLYLRMKQWIEVIENMGKQK